MYKYTIELYKNNSENNDVQKYLTDKKTMQGISRNELDILSPRITLTGIQVNEYNYCYVKELKRYYYIENITFSPNGSVEMYLKVDVLMSFITDIKASSGLITKQKNYNPYYVDDETECRTDITKHEFENKLNYDTDKFVLVTLRS